MNLKRYSQQKPVQTAVVLFLIIVVLRLLDVFVIRSDEIFGEQYLTKVVGMILVFGYVWHVKGNWGSIGFYKRGWGTATSASLLRSGQKPAEASIPVKKII